MMLLIKCGMDTIVEVHNDREMSFALSLKKKHHWN
jgi:indole-3-glycerol phosphate synthase